MTHLAQSDFAQEIKKVQSELGSWDLRGAQKGSSSQRPFMFQGLVTKCLLSRPGRVTGNTKGSAKEVILNLIVPISFVKCL